MKKKPNYALFLDEINLYLATCAAQGKDPLKATPEERPNPLGAVGK